MAALAVSGLVLLGAVRLVDTLGQARDFVRRDARIGDAAANGEWVLRSLIERAATRTDSVERFEGDEAHVAFTSYCEVPVGWLELCRIRFSLGSIRDSGVVFAVVDDGPPRRLWSWLGGGRFRYFDPASRDDTWVHSWGRSIAPPTALGIVLASDTLVFPTGGRP